MSEWIAVKDKLPKPYERVLVYAQDLRPPYTAEADIQTYFPDGWEFRDLYDVQYWQSIPEAPKE